MLGTYNGLLLRSSKFLIVARGILRVDPTIRPCIPPRTASLREAPSGPCASHHCTQRRECPTRAVQFVQINMHKALRSVFRNPGPAKAPWQLKLMMNIPGWQRATGRVLGLGIRPEHVRTAAKRPACRGQLLAKIAIAAGLLAGGAILAARLIGNSRKRRYA